MKTLTTFLVLIGSLFLHGCSVKHLAVGIEPDDVSQIQIGSSREQVEELLDAPIEVSECPGGTRAKFVYDRGNPPEGIGPAAVVGVFSFFSLGTFEAKAYCWDRCQRGILEIDFDDNDTVVLLRPQSEPYDVGWNCSSGDAWTHYCKPTQNTASRMDTARLIQGPDDMLIETGCFMKFSVVCQLAHDKHAFAQYRLGILYRDGELPVSRSRVQAYKWFSLAMQSGSLKVEGARGNVAGTMLADELEEAERLVSQWQPNPAECGIGRRERVFASYPEAAYLLALSAAENDEQWYWFCIAAHYRYPKAQLKLGDFYLWGSRPVDEDLVQAYAWYSLAGDEANASLFRDNIASRMTPDQIAEAKRRAAQWQPKPAECEAIAAQSGN